jgi:hypothetical protein
MKSAQAPSRFPLSQDWERDWVRVGWAELPGFSSRVVTLTPPLSREPGEGVLWRKEKTY